MPDGHSAGGGQAHAAGASSSPVDADPYVGRRLGDVRGTMSSAARSLNGCRFLVRMVAEGGAAAARQVLEEVAGEIVRLMVDSVAHKLVEKLVEHLADDQITRVLHILAASPGQIVTFITVVVTSSFFFHHVCRDRHGCNVLNSFIDKTAGDRQPWNSLIVAVCRDALALAEHGYSNYVVQQVIRSVPEARDCLHTTFRGQYVSLSRQAASSHVVQRCLELFCSEHVDEIIRELLGCHRWGCRFPQLISDPYANYK
nr:unnamed protein product [Digitaria exilis]